MLWVRGDHEQIDLLGTDVVSIPCSGFPQRLLQFILNCRKEVLIVQRLAPELDYELIVHLWIVGPTIWWWVSLTRLVRTDRACFDFSLRNKSPPLGPANAGRNGMQL